MSRCASALFLLLLVGWSFGQDPKDSSRMPPTANTDRGVLETLKPAPELKVIMDRLDAMENSLKKRDTDMTTFINLIAERLQQDINTLRDQVRRLQQDVDANRRRDSERQSLKPIETGTATLMIINGHPTLPMETVVNNVVYTVPPGQSQSVTVPAGVVNFQVLQTDAYVRSRSLAPGASHQVTMR